MTWRFQPAMDSFEARRADWDSLNRSLGHHILLDSAFTSALLRHFADSKVFLGWREESPITGAVLAVRKAPGIWETFQPSQAPLGPFLLSRTADAPDAISEMMADLPGFALQVAVTQQDPDFSALTPSLAGEGVEYLAHIRTPRLALSGTCDDYWVGRKKKLRENLARYRRRLEKEGYALQFVVRRSPGDVEEALREYCRLETTGWKGREGSAVSEQNEQGPFYREVLEHFCAQNEGMIVQLFANDRLIASRLALVRNGMMVMLKTAYDEAFSAHAPGMLLMQDLLTHLYAEGQVKVIEFYGSVKEWHTHWTEDSRELFHLNFLRHQLVGRAKALVSRWR